MAPAPREGAVSVSALAALIALAPDDLDIAVVARAELTALLSAADAARAKAIEECAKVCDATVTDGEPLMLRLDGGFQRGIQHRVCEAKHLARQIRALATTERANTETPR